MKKLLNKKLLCDYFIKHKLDAIFGPEIPDGSLLLSYEKDDIILSAGAELEFYYLLVEGKVKVAYPMENGKTMLLKFYQDFNVIGDLELLKNMPVRCNVEAIGRCIFIAVPSDTIRQTYLNYPDFLRHLADSLSDKLNSTIGNSCYNVAYPLANRLASYLTEYLTGGDTIRLSATFQEIASFLGTSYRHLSRTLNDLEMQSIIRCEGKAVYVLDEKRLRDLSRNSYQSSF